MKRSLDALQEQIRICEEDLVYFEQMEEQLKHCSYEDAREIRQELENGRWLLPKKEPAAEKANPVPTYWRYPLKKRRYSPAATICRTAGSPTKWPDAAICGSTLRATMALT